MRRKRYLRPKRIVRECSVLEWVKIQNAKGLSPSGPAIYEKLMEVHPARRHSDVEPLAHMSQQGRRYARQWLLRLRKRVRLVRGRFKPGPALSQEAMRKKACAHTRIMMWSRMGRDHAQKHLPVWILFYRAQRWLKDMRTFFQRN